MVSYYIAERIGVIIIFLTYYLFFERRVRALSVVKPFMKVSFRNDVYLLI